jgi:hypothetical protein
MPASLAMRMWGSVPHRLAYRAQARATSNEISGGGAQTQAASTPSPCLPDLAAPRPTAPHRTAPCRAYPGLAIPRLDRALHQVRILVNEQAVDGRLPVGRGSGRARRRRTVCPADGRLGGRQLGCRGRWCVRGVLGV